MNKNDNLKNILCNWCEDVQDEPIKMITANILNRFDLCF